MGTSAPELVVSAQSALDVRSGVAADGGIAVGNAVGSNICNIALVLGLSALLCPILVTRQFFRFDIPALAGASFLTWYFLSDGVLGVWEGVALLALFAGYMAFNIAHARDGGAVAGDGAGAAVAKGWGAVAKDLSLVLLGLGMLVGGAKLLVLGAVEIAASFSVSEAVIGLTIVAFGTSLPELATSIVAAARKHNDIAVGNVIGSNMFNILCILGVVGVMGPSGRMNIGDIELRDMLFMSLTSVAVLLPLLTKRTLTRWTGGLLAGTYVAYILMLALGVGG
jgi:cation:H+ antiporter